MLWRGVSAACVVGLSGSAVSIAGPVGFVGLVVPHMVRMTIGVEYVRLLPVAALGGALLVLLADTAPRAVFATDLPVGITMAFIGAPFFIWLARNHGAVRG
ncbi:iron chelate uptake ABC transporter family permease subunit [Rhodobacteraceae bacterium D3-12]|nr:iron chelate uptake ABC transporter family permease subunit [Rhodobacteraceae bacterium D3-12]